MFKINLVNLPSPLKIKMDYKFPEVLPVKLQKKEVQPRTVSQLVYPDSGFNGLSEVSVNAVTKDIDENIKSENIKKDVSILGVQGNIEELKGTKLEITKNGTYTPEEPYNAFTEVDVITTNDPTEWFENEYIITRDSGKLNFGVFNTLKKLPLLTLNGTSTYNLFRECNNIETIPALDTSNVIDMESMCQNCTSLTHIPMLNTSNVTNMSYMFYYCPKLTSIPLLDTSNVTTMKYMFYMCRELTSIPLLDTSNVTDMSFMFYSSALSTIPLLNTSKVTNMQYTFRNMQNLIVFPALDTSNVTTFNEMFDECKNLTTLPLLNASKVINVRYFIDNCYVLTDIGGFENLGQAYETSKSANESAYALSFVYGGYKATHDSLMNVINNLYDIASKGVKTQRLILPAECKARLTAEEIAIATNKGWTVG